MKHKERIAITGAAGSIGSELVRQLSKKYWIYGVDTNESGLHDITLETGIEGRVGDIRDYDTVNDIFSDIKPTKVFHAAAYKHVGAMEVVPMEAIQTNVIGTYNMLHCAKRYEVDKFVFISTDKVVNATSVMGQTKKLSETMTLNQGYTAVRFGNVLHSRGSLFPIWYKRIEQRKSITVTDERMERYFMSIDEAVELVIEASKGKGGNLYILDMGERKKIIDLAKEFAEANDLPIEIIGMRPGETLIERLMTEEEEKIAVKKGKFFIIKNQLC